METLTDLGKDELDQLTKGNRHDQPPPSAEQSPALPDGASPGARSGASPAARPPPSPGGDGAFSSKPPASPATPAAAEAGVAGGLAEALLPRIDYRAYLSALGVAYGDTQEEKISNLFFVSPP